MDVAFAVDIRLGDGVGRVVALVIRCFIDLGFFGLSLGARDVRRRLERAHDLQSVERGVLIAVGEGVLPFDSADLVVDPQAFVHRAETVVEVFREPARPLGRFSCCVDDVVIVVLQNQVRHAEDRLRDAPAQLHQRFVRFVVAQVAVRVQEKRILPDDGVGRGVGLVDDLFHIDLIVLDHLRGEKLVKYLRDLLIDRHRQPEHDLGRIDVRRAAAFAARVDAFDHHGVDLAVFADDIRAELLSFRLRGVERVDGRAAERQAVPGHAVGHVVVGEELRAALFHRVLGKAHCRDADGVHILALHLGDDGLGVRLALLQHAHLEPEAVLALKIIVLAGKRRRRLAGRDIRPAGEAVSPPGDIFEQQHRLCRAHGRLFRRGDLRFGGALRLQGLVAENFAQRVHRRPQAVVIRRAVRAVIFVLGRVIGEPCPFRNEAVAVADVIGDLFQKIGAVEQGHRVHAHMHRAQRILQPPPAVSVGGYGGDGIVTAIEIAAA